MKTSPTTSSTPRVDPPMAGAPRPPDVLRPSPALTVAELDRHGRQSHEVYTAGFYDSDWDYAVRCVLGQASRGGADAGEVLATIAAIADDDSAAWLAAWTALGRRITAIADAAAQRGHRVSAARAYLRAANYLDVAVNAMCGGDRSDDMLPAFLAHRAVWESFVANTSWPVERVDIPYEGTSLPGWVFHPSHSAAARPTLVVDHGVDGSMSGGWCASAAGALERGYRVLMFDGPGQQSMLFERDVPLRHDWEHVLTPVADFLTARADVDTTRIAVHGISQAGFSVPRALAFEHRFAAAVIEGAAVDVSRSWFERVPAPLLPLYRDGQVELFDQLMHQGMRPDHNPAHRLWRRLARPYGVSGYALFLDEVAQYQLGDLARQITTPTYVIDTDGEQFLPGQPIELAQRLTWVTHARFTQDEGASYHGQPLARELTEQRIFDWLDERLA